METVKLICIGISCVERSVGAADRIAKARVDYASRNLVYASSLARWNGFDAAKGRIVNIIVDQEIGDCNEVNNEVSTANQWANIPIKRSALSVHTAV